MRPYLVRPRPPSRLAWERRWPAIVRRDGGYYWTIRGGSGELASSDGPMSRRRAESALAEIIRSESDDHLLSGEVVSYHITADHDTQRHCLYVMRYDDSPRLRVYHEIWGRAGQRCRLIRECRTALGALGIVERRLKRDRIAGGATDVCWIEPID